MNDGHLNIDGVWLEASGPPLLEDITLRLHAGEVLGLVGPAGSGKTALLRVLATLEAPTRGQVSLCGLDLVQDQAQVRRRSSYVASIGGAYPRLRVSEYLEFFARAAGNHDPHAAELGLDLAQLTGKAQRSIHSLEAAEQHRLQVARALLPDPQLLLIDEPPSALDRAARSSLYELAGDLAALGKIVVLAARSGQELAQVCSQIGAMQAGRLLVQRASLLPAGGAQQLDLFRGHEWPAEARRGGVSLLLLRIWPLNDAAALSELLEAQPAIEDVEIGERVRIRHRGNERFVADLVRKLTAAGFDVVGVEQAHENERAASATSHHPPTLGNENDASPPVTPSEGNDGPS
jgi:ABC-type multidrug transport system ATPase subunit